MKPTIGQHVTVRGIVCEIVAIRLFDTIDVVSLDGRFAWRLSGLGF